MIRASQKCGTLSSVCVYIYMLILRMRMRKEREERREKEKEKREKEGERIFEKVVPRKFPGLMKSINLYLNKNLQQTLHT